MTEALPSAMDWHARRRLDPHGELDTCRRPSQDIPRTLQRLSNSANGIDHRIGISGNPQLRPLSVGLARNLCQDGRHIVQLDLNEASSVTMVFPPRSPGRRSIPVTRCRTCYWRATPFLSDLRAGGATVALRAVPNTFDELEAVHERLWSDRAILSEAGIEITLLDSDPITNRVQVGVAGASPAVIEVIEAKYGRGMVSVLEFAPPILHAGCVSLQDCTSTRWRGGIQAIPGGGGACSG